MVQAFMVNRSLTFLDLGLDPSEKADELQSQLLQIVRANKFI